MKVFNYIEALDCFTADPLYRKVAEVLGLAEWSCVVWVGRLLMLDNDYGEHIFDNWDERDEIEEKAKELGIEVQDALIVVPSKFQNGKDGPCHDDAQRKRFWTDVLKSLDLSTDTLFAEARSVHESHENYQNQIVGKSHRETYDVEARIAEAKQLLGVI